MKKILSINPGSTSTKLGYYEDDKEVFIHTIRHSAEELKPYNSIFDQYDFRKKVILDVLKEKNVDIQELSAVIGRGGMVRPLESGVYEVNDKMIEDLKIGVGGMHASNLGGVLAKEIASMIPNCRSFIADPVVVDEMQEVARISGLPQIPRRPTFHALNHKAIGRKYAKDHNTKYEDLNLVIAHLGGGVSVAAHRKGKVVDTNQALDGFGPFSPERAGTVDAGVIVRMAFSGDYTQEEMLKMLCGKGGLMAHLGTNEAHVVEKNAEAGDKKSKLLMDALSYNVAKGIGEMLAVLEGDVDAIILTGGIAYGKMVTEYITKMVGKYAPVAVYPGEDEMGALAGSALRVLNGETAKVY
ncbi:butyrate kinase [Paludibacteraceae bacterium OttesenSCG-928-F17]|nr:butyrate kinase [Paludibacteraceae bacterium OttesenSCG-928-F17]